MAGLGSGTAVVLTCPPCWDEWFPGRQPPGHSNGASSCIVDAGCEAGFVAHGFTVLPGIVDGTDIPGLLCPHLAEEDSA